MVERVPVAVPYYNNAESWWPVGGFRGATHRTAEAGVLARTLGDGTPRLLHGNAVAGDNEGLHYSSGASVLGSMRSPAWSPDGTKVVYEKSGWATRALYKDMWSWDPAWEYRFIVLPGRTLPSLRVRGH